MNQTCRRHFWHIASGIPSMVLKSIYNDVRRCNSVKFAKFALFTKSRKAQVLALLGGCHECDDQSGERNCPRWIPLVKLSRFGFDSGAACLAKLPVSML